MLQIDFHNLLQEQKGEYCQGELPFSIDVKGGEKNSKTRSMKTGGVNMKTRGQYSHWDQSTKIGGAWLFY
jgi:hypothetical protein